MTDTGGSNWIAFVNRLLGDGPDWSSLNDLLKDFCTAAPAKSAGIRWPAVGQAVYLCETSRTSSTPPFQHTVQIADQMPGTFWVNGSSLNHECLRLTAQAIGRSPGFLRLLGPVVEQGRIAQRLADAARVAGRVAHDLDNVFQGVMGFHCLTLELLEPGSQAYQNLTEADTAARHGMKFCAQLHQLSRAGNAKPMPAQLGPALSSEVTRLQRANPKLRFEMNLERDFPEVCIDSSGLQTILGLLLDNAAEATPPNGAVTISAKLTELAEEDLAGILGLPSTGPYVAVEIRDGGAGVSEESRKRMFVEPFFTTKFRHRGLGLAVVYRMLHAYRGGVRVECKPGVGTTVQVVLPLASVPLYNLQLSHTTGGSIS